MYTFSSRNEASFFKECEIILKGEEKLDKNVHVESKKLNIYYSPIFASYLLDNWCGLISFRTSLHLGDQGRHGSSQPYDIWSKNFTSGSCVVEPPRT